MGTSLKDYWLVESYIFAKTSFVGNVMNLMLAKPPLQGYYGVVPLLPRKYENDQVLIYVGESGTLPRGSDERGERSHEDSRSNHVDLTYKSSIWSHEVCQDDRKSSNHQDEVTRSKVRAIDLIQMASSLDLHIISNLLVHQWKQRILAQLNLC